MKPNSNKVGDLRSPKDVLNSVWGFSSFRPLQEEIITSVLDGHDTMALLPTGGGKSLCFQVPGIILPGITLVISPLIALMQDQVDNLKAKGISAYSVHSGLSSREIDMVLDNCRYGEAKFLYLSPERLRSELFQERAPEMDIRLVVVDEAHCISQWGFDFRPAYLQIPQFREQLPETRIIALTATATPKVQEDIVNNLGLRQPKVFLQSYARPNLSYSVRKEEDKERHLIKILSRINGSAIVYARTRKWTKKLSSILRDSGISSSYYHGGLSSADRSRIQNEWLKNEFSVIVATNAFGMGIDKPDVRLVVHWDIPENLESYYQEAGRAGRDQKKAFAVLIHNENDIESLKAWVSLSYPDPESIKNVYQCIANHYKLAVGSGHLASFDFDLQSFCSQFKLKPVETFNALKKLEENDLIHLSPAFHHPSRVFIQSDNTTLYRFQVANPKLDPLIKTLLRMHGGELFAGFTRISEAKISNYGGFELKEVIDGLIKLHQLEILHYIRQSSKPQLTFLSPRMNSSKLPIGLKELQQRKENDLSKLRAMVRYLQDQNRCRTQQIQEYFGETSYQRCGVCDNCQRQREIKNTANLTNQIRKLVSKSEISPAKILDQFGPEDEPLVLEVIRNMLDNQEIAYNQFGQLVLTNKKE